MGALISALTSRLESSGERVMLTVVGYLAVMLLLVAAFIALVYAGATAVSQVYGPVIAALTVAGCTIVAALVLIVWLSMRRKRLVRQARIRRALEPATLTAATTVLPVLLKASPLGTLAAVAAAAYVIAKASQRTD
jgi:hypothetical protein